MARITPPTKPPVFEDFGKKTDAHIQYRTSQGRRVPGGSTVAGLLDKSKFMIPWAARLGAAGKDPNKHRDEAAFIGSLAHYLIECELTGTEPDLGDYTPNQGRRAQHSFDGWKEWRGGRKLTPLMVEWPMVSDALWYGGTIDLYADLDGLPVLIDNKSATGIYREHKIQIAGYWHLLVEAGEKPKGVRIIHIPRNPLAAPTEHVITGALVLKYWEIFQRLLDTYWLLREVDGREDGD